MSRRRVPEYRLTLARERTLTVGEACGSQTEAERVIGAWYKDREPFTESMIMLGLDGRNRVIGVVEVARGGAHGCAVTASDILRPALVMGASAIIVAHNHPSGDPTPSPEDMHMTRALCSACDAVGLPLLDHLTWTPNGSESCMPGGAR